MSTSKNCECDSDEYESQGKCVKYTYMITGKIEKCPFYATPDLNNFCRFNFSSKFKSKIKINWKKKKNILHTKIFLQIFINKILSPKKSLILRHFSFFIKMKKQNIVTKSILFLLPLFMITLISFY